jgi:hypothetical protein
MTGRLLVIVMVLLQIGIFSRMISASALMSAVPEMAAVSE